MPTTKRTSQRRSKSGISWKKISNERKLDILGIIMALVGFLTILSLLSTQRSEVTGWWINSISKVAGWGTFILPFALMVIGVWLVLRNIEKFPPLSTERVVGVVLLYL
ncbi:MAG: hypothetical protein HGB14_01750, partial [Anaerolineaceae bacterium]|nr:hypothetical protein [Anaerolineaceae bacterium]